jgi:hypothetical protein
MRGGRVERADMLDEMKVILEAIAVIVVVVVPK